jgi:hypothetical protein
MAAIAFISGPGPGRQVEIAGLALAFDQGEFGNRPKGLGIALEARLQQRRHVLHPYGPVSRPAEHSEISSVPVRLLSTIETAGEEM